MVLLSRSLRALYVAGPVLIAPACSGEAPPPAPIVLGAPSVDQADPVSGAPDNGDDPAVIALDVAGRLCSGALIAPDVVITARHCVSALVGPVECPAKGAQIAGSTPARSVRILLGDDVSSAVERATGRALVVPPTDSLCGADIALVLLDEPVDDVQPLTVRPTGAANGDRVKSIGFGRFRGAGASMTKLVRDQVLVLGTTSAELLVAEAPCDKDGCGGPAIDETSGEIVGVASRSVPGASMASNAYTRADAFFNLIENALAGSVFSTAEGAGVLKAKKGSPDLGANCVRGADCSAGACVTVGVQRYCSRSCSGDDACPAHFRCEQSQQGEAVCVEK
ncbi:MAG: trypsin-like serine protease [Polyangiaceae bacterium]